MNLYIYCAGGFGREVLDIARRLNAIHKVWNDICFVDDIYEGSFHYEAKVYKINDEKIVKNLSASRFVIANGEPQARQKISDKLKLVGAKFENVVDASTLVSDSAILEDGIIISPFCSISSNAYLAHNSSINTMSIIGHDAKVGQNTVISSMVNLGGSCTVGNASYIGMGALIKERVKIGSNTIIGMGSVVFNDIPDNVIALGNPARVMRTNTDQKVFKEKKVQDDQ